MAAKRVTNAELLAELIALRQAHAARDGRIDEIARRVEEILRAQAVYAERQKATRETVKANAKEISDLKKVVLGENGGSKRKGHEQRIAALERVVEGTMNTLKRAAWIIVAAFLAGVGGWLAHLAGFKF